DDGHRDIDAGHAESQVLHRHRLEREEEQRQHQGEQELHRRPWLSVRVGKAAEGCGASTTTSSTFPKFTAGRMPALRNIPLVWRCTAVTRPTTRPGGYTPSVPEVTTRAPSSRSSVRSRYSSFSDWSSPPPALPTPARVRRPPPP